MGEGRGGSAGQGAPGWRRARPDGARLPPSSPGCALRGSAKQSRLPIRGEAPPVYGCYFFLSIQGSSYYLYLTFAAKALLSPAS